MSPRMKAFLADLANIMERHDVHSIEAGGDDNTFITLNDGNEEVEYPYISADIIKEDAK